MSQTSRQDILSRIVYLNGRFVPMEQACVSVLDRGFIFGDAVYEVIPVYHGFLFRLRRHLQRLHNSLTAIHLTNPHSKPDWCSLLEELLVRNSGSDGSVYVQVTRGVAARDHAFPLNIPPTVYAMWTPKSPPPQGMLDNGVAAMTHEDIRWQYCHIKSTALLANVLLRQQASENGCYEAILVRDGEVTEGAASNVFTVTGDTIITPPTGPALLPGITRDLVLELAHSNGIRAVEKTVPEKALRDADEIWLTSSTREIIAVTRLDDTAVGHGRPGPLWHRMASLFRHYRENYGGDRENPITAQKPGPYPVRS